MSLLTIGIIVLVIAALAGSRFARRFIGVTVGLGCAAVFLLWLFFGHAA